jgi:subtilase family serine protease
MIQRIGVILFALAVSLSSVNVICQAKPQTFLTRHTRDAVVNGTAPLLGHLPESQSMRFDVVLALRHQPGLLDFLKDSYDPSSPNYRQYVTPSEFTERFGPSQEDCDAVLEFAKANGLTVTGGSRDSMDIQMSGTVGAVERAFHVQLNLYRDPTEDRTFFALDREPTVDLPFQLWHVTGLDNYSIPRPALVRRIVSRDNAPTKSNATTGSGPDASFLGSDMRAAYYGGTSLTGTGQYIGLLEYAGTDLADLTDYYTNVKQTEPYIPTLVSVDGYSTSCLYSSGCDDTEQTLDMTQAMGMAPGSLGLYMFVCGNGSSFSDTACLSTMSSIDYSAVSNLSSSWTWTPPDPSTDDPYFEKMASQGQSFFQASGDSGAYFGTALWPANAAYVIAVGGTDLTTKSAGGAWASETAWADGGGGYGTNVDIPSWQVASVDACSSCNKTYRNVPDVAANANFTFYVCSDQGKNPNFGGQECGANIYGGTSFAAPMWAGYLTLANQQASQSGKAALGFINTVIYPLSHGDGDADFHDITSGSNGATCSSGYNECDGWGSPNGASLINALVAADPAFPYAVYTGLPSNSCNFPSDWLSFSLIQQTNAASLTWAESGSLSSEGQEMIFDLTWNWTLSDADGEFLSGSGLENENVTASRAPVGAPTLAVSGTFIGENGCYGTFSGHVTGSN